MNEPVSTASSNDMLLLSLLISVLGLLVIGGLVWFGFCIFKGPKNDKLKEWPMVIEELFHRWTKHGYREYDDIPKLLFDSYTEFLERRNEFWTSYGQVLLAVLIVIVLTILLITKTISAEAGLPILSGISGFAIAKGVSTSKSNSSSPQPRRPNER
jgi:ABC-type glycerol-3-phosphate transport system permease component